MKHIRQSPQEHATGSFDVTEDIAGFASPAYLGAIFTFPVNKGVEKSIPICRGLNPGNLEKDFPELLGVGGSWRCAAPGQTLPLYMDQASLHSDIRPKLSDNLYHVGIAIYREALWAQSSQYQTFEEFTQLRLRILGDAILSNRNHVCLGIHQGNDTPRTMQKGTVKNEVLALSQIERGLRRRLLQIVIYHLIKLPLAISALPCQLSDRITFDKPVSKQIPFSEAFNRSVAPLRRVPARRAKPTLFSFSIMTISSKISRTERTKFFSYY